MEPKQVCAALLAAANAYPGQRIGQLISNALLVGMNKHARNVDTFYITDEELCRALYAYIEYGVS